MTLSDISQLRLSTQKLFASNLKTPAEVVAWMGAMQAQDPRMVMWGLGSRFTGGTHEAVTNAINEGEVIRTHLMRPTWHLVSAADVYWMLELTAPQIKRTMRARHKELQLSEEMVSWSNDLIARALEGGKHLTRDELVAKFQQAQIALDNNRAAHLLMSAELDGIICSGPMEGNKQTYTLLEDWVPRRETLTREEALARLAKKYFTSHGPATLADFAWWSALPAADTREALESVKLDLSSFEFEEQEYWFAIDTVFPASHPETAFFLPSFDEFLISYKDRRATLAQESQNKAVSSNGIFRPIMVLNGETIGIWKQSNKQGSVLIEPTFFQKPDEETKIRLTAASAIYAQFLEKPVEISFPEYFDF